VFLPDGRLTYFSSEKKGLIAGIEAVRRHHEGFWFAPGGRPRGSQLWLEGLTITQLGEAVVACAEWRFRPAGSQEVQRGPDTLV
jgi:hypothetical protein